MRGDEGGEGDEREPLYIQLAGIIVLIYVVHEITQIGVPSV